MICICTIVTQLKCSVTYAYDVDLLAETVSDAYDFLPEHADAYDLLPVNIYTSNKSVKVGFHQHRGPKVFVLSWQDTTSILESILESYFN